MTYPLPFVSQEIVVGSNMDKIYIVMNYVEHDLKSLMETMKQPFLPGRARGTVGTVLSHSCRRGPLLSPNGNRPPSGHLGRRRVPDPVTDTLPLCTCTPPRAVLSRARSDVPWGAWSLPRQADDPGP